MLADELRHCIATQSETGLLVAADALQESDCPRNNKLGELLRCYVDIQTYVRVSQPIPHDLGIRYDELNKFFETSPTKGYYSKPIGIYYTACNIYLDTLLDNFKVLETEPIRELTIRGCSANAGLKTVLTNYRVDWMYEVTIKMGNTINNPLELADIVRVMQGSQLQRLNIHGVRDRSKRLQTMFQLNTSIRKGTRLTLSESIWSEYNTTTCVKIR